MQGLAVVFEGKDNVVVRNVDIPEPQAKDVVIDVKYSWISIGTESSFLRGERISGEQMVRPGDPQPYPHVPGYQKVGVVRSVGSRVDGIRVGDVVFATISKVSGMFFDFAGHISPAVTPVDQVWKLPGDVQPEDYAGLVLTQVGYNCGARPKLEEGDIAVVIGDGLVGQWAAHTLEHRGARVMVLGRHDERLAHLPKTIQAVNTHNASIEDALAKMDGVQVVIHSAGDMDTVERLIPFMRHNSHLVSAGFLGNRGMIDIQKLRPKEITLHTPSGWQKDRMDATLTGILEGWLHPSSLITHRFRVEDASRAWDAIRTSKQSILGVLLEW